MDLVEHYNKKLKKYEDLLTKLEYAWAFEWVHDGRHEFWYNRIRSRLERKITKLRMVLGLEEGETS